MMSAADQTSSDSDQSSSDRDQAAADSDQAASDRDLARGTDPRAHELSQNARERSAHQRERTAGRREQTAHERDGHASRLQHLRAHAGVREAATSQLHLAALVDSSEDAIMSKTLSGEIVSWNHGAQELFGYTPEEAIGTSILLIVPPERHHEVAQIMVQVRRGERVEALETKRVAKDGRLIDVSLRVSVIYNAAGEVTGASSIQRDITARKLAEVQMRRSSRYFELSRDLTVSVGFDGYLMNVNPAVTRILGWSTAQFLERPLIDMIHRDDRASTLTELEKLAGGQGAARFVSRCETHDGGYRVLDWHAVVPPDEQLVYASARDITERMEMEVALGKAEKSFRAVFDRAPIGVCLLSLASGATGLLQQVNQALAGILGTSIQDLTGVPVDSLAHPGDRADIDARLHELVDGTSDYIELEKRFMHRDGHVIWVLLTAAPLSDDDAEQTFAVAHLMDISDRKRSEGELRHLADHDSLTGLFHRRRFTEELQRSLRQASRFDEAGAVMFVDLDGFKFVNDTLGHAAGDELIIQVAGLLRGALRETDLIARIGGDEFAILLVCCDEQGARDVAEKLLTTLRRNAVVVQGEDQPTCLSSSIGVAFYRGAEHRSADELLAEADIAMYDAKDAGKDRFAIFDRNAKRRDLT